MQGPSPTWRRLGQDTAASWLKRYPKIARLDLLREAGVRVPPGIYGRGEDALHHGHLKRNDGASWILRSVMPGEDEEGLPMTGLSLSIPDLRDIDAIEHARLACRAHAHQLFVEQRRVPEAVDAIAWLIQAQVPARRLVIAIFDPTEGRWYLESYSPGPDPFSGRKAPQLRAFLEDALPTDFAASQLRGMLQQVSVLLPCPAGLEVELVQDTSGLWHCVQAKPNATQIFSQYRGFLSAAREQLRGEGRTLDSYTYLCLDAEHNPEPLSPAHCWLMDKLGGGKGEPAYVVLAGWLYSTRPCASTDTSQEDVTLAPLLARIEQELLPSASALLNAFSQRHARIERASIRAALRDAIEACQAILGIRARWIDPITKQRPRTLLRKDFSFASTLSGRSAFAQYLPTRWDIAAPSLAQAKLPPAATEPGSIQLPEDLGTQWDLLDEWDDHLFALALAVPRMAWSRIAALLEIPEEELFMVDGHSLEAFGDASINAKTLRARCQQGGQRFASQCQLVPPLLLLHGQVAPPSTSMRWRGLPFGEPFSGFLCPRKDLEALLARPVDPETSVLAMPALTAPAALALHRLGIRAVVAEHGGLASHGARMAAELGLSALVGCKGCMEVPEGQAVYLDTRNGRLRRQRDASRENA